MKHFRRKAEEIIGYYECPSGVMYWAVGYEGDAVYREVEIVGVNYKPWGGEFDCLSDDESARLHALLEKLYKIAPPMLHTKKTEEDDW
jgi:hypothetical protein